MSEKKAVLVTSFGTSYLDTLEKNIAAIESDIAAALPGRKLRRAFTSGVILSKLRSRDGLDIDDVPAALDRLLSEGVEDVVIQPTHVINGVEYDKLRAQAAPYRGRFRRMAFGDPLLTAAEDYKALARALMDAVEAPAEDEALIFMGHGTEHYSNSAYALMEYVFRDRGWDRAYVGTVEGYPSLEEVIRRLEEAPRVRRVIIHPLMVVAGDHARHDMAGAGPGSWKSRLEGAGYAVTCSMRGLGEYPGIRALFAARAREAES